MCRMHANSECSENSFYTSSLVVLYINLVMNIYEVAFFSPQYPDLLKRKYFGEELKSDSHTFNFNGIVFPLLEILVFLCAIISVSKKKSSMLTFTIAVLLMDMISSVLSSISSFYVYHKNCENGTNKTACETIDLWVLKPDNTMKEVGKSLPKVEFSPTGVLIILTFVCLLSVVFKSCCIIVLHEYKVAFKDVRIQREINVQESSHVDLELPCYSLVERSYSPPRYVVIANSEVE